MTDSRLMRSTTSVLSLGCCCSRHVANRGPVTAPAPPAPDRARREPRAAPDTTGSAGTTGTSGSVGTTGSAGTTGDAGTTGTAGSVGTTGDAGTTGTAGSVGTTGDAGTTGTAGRGGATVRRDQRGHDRRGGSRRKCRQRGRHGRRDNRHRWRGGNDDRRLCAPHDDAQRCRRRGGHEDHVQRQRRLVLVSGRARHRRHQGWQADHRLCRQRRESRTGNIEAVVYDLAAGTKIGPTKIGNLSVDDHNAPAFNIRPDGKYVATWATHRTDCNTYYSIFDGSAWAAQKTFDWKTQGCPWDGDPTHMITYNNLWYMGSTLFDVSRSVGTSPNLLASTDDGQTWSYYGRLTYTPLTGYVAGYYKYWGNNTDRIDWIGTEAHPRDANTSLWHGYASGGKIYNSTGTVVDDALAGTSATTSAKNVDQYTAVFKTGSTVNGVKLEHAWNHDVVRYADGTIAVLGQARVTGTGTDDPDKRLLYFRFDGTTWKTTYLAKAGTKLYAAEQDYTGLGALVPDDPTTIYISTPFNPTTDTMASGGKREIWRGTTCDNGATFKWTPVTANSTKDNIRPIVPKWDATHTALLWMQGTYSTAQSYSMAIVGVLTTKP